MGELDSSYVTDPLNVSYDPEWNLCEVWRSQT